MAKYTVSILINGEWTPVQVPSSIARFDSIMHFCKRCLKNTKGAEAFSLTNLDTLEIWEYRKSFGR